MSAFTQNSLMENRWDPQRAHLPLFSLVFSAPSSPSACQSAGLDISPLKKSGNEQFDVKFNFSWDSLIQEGMPGERIGVAALIVLIPRCRYFHLKSHNLSVTYLQQFGSLPMRGHYVGECNGKGSVQLKMGEIGNDKQKIGSCGPEGMTKEALAMEGKVLDDWQFHKNGDAKFDWGGMIGDVFKYVVPFMGVDMLFWNSGIWHEYHDENEVAELMRLGTAALVPHGRGGPETYWKTTTAKKKCHKIGKKCLLKDKKEIVVFNGDPTCVTLRTRQPHK